jgi:homoserine kinase
MASPRKLRLHAPASTSNVGPGYDTFSIALDTGLEVAYVEAEKTTLTRLGGLEESPLRTGQDPVIRGLRRAARLLGRKLPPGELTVSAPYPPGRGLGASGSGLVAGLMLGNRLCGGDLPAAALLEEAIALEGNPENALAAFKGGAHWSVADGKGDYLHLPLVLHRNLRFLLVIPPYPMVTAEARKVLPQTVPHALAVRQMQKGPLLLRGLRSLDPEMIRLGLKDELHVAPRLPLLAGAKAMIGFAEDAGALGATLSGAGSALLVLTRTGQMRDLEARLKSRVARLWGESGQVLGARLQPKGAAFLR